MIKIIRNSSPLIVVVCALLLVQVMGCSEDSDTDEGDTSGAPSLPPDESMILDLSLFEEKVNASPGVATLTSYMNFINAGARITTISSSIAAAITPPAAVFAAAKTNEPVEQDDGSWLWSYGKQIEHITFAANLTGTTKGNETHWSMRVSSTAVLRPLTDFEWYTGVSTETNTSGSWQFYDMQTPEKQNPTVKIDWSVQLLKVEARLTLENTDPRSVYMGDTLEYSTNLKTASMTYNDVSEGETWEIVWDIETGAGSITVPGYNNGEKACWSAGKEDVPCD